MKSGKDTESKQTKPSIVEVIPVSKGIFKPSLSYFTTQDLSVGEFVQVPVRNGKVQSIVARVHSAEESKTEIKSSSFALKKVAVDKQNESRVKIPSKFITAAQRTAEYYSTSLGSVLGSLLPKLILDNPELVFSFENLDGNNTERPRNEPFIIQLEDSERFVQYQNIVRESLARKNSVLFISPTEEEAVRAFNFLSKGIGEYSYLFTLSQNKTQLKKTLKEARLSDKPVLFVTTPSGVAFTKSELNTIILDRENSRAYRTISRPYIHLKTFLKYLVSNSDKRLILGDSVLSIESMYKEREGEYKDFFPLKWRLSSQGQTRLIDMKADHRESKEFKIFSPELLELIQKSLNEGEKIYLYGARKGLSPTTICEDCGSVLACKNCGAPVILHKGETSKGTIYVCHACRSRRPSETSCDSCHSWRLKAIGIGVDLIAREVSELFPEANVLVLDKTRASTPSKARKIVSQFNGGGEIIVGTEMALLYLDKVTYSGIVSLDALFSIPDFSVNERIFYLITKLKELTEKDSIVQTRNIGKMVLTWASSGNILDFYKSEIEERKELFYPPFSLFIKISPLSKRASQEMSEIRDSLLRWKPDMIKDSIIIRLERNTWPDRELSENLSLLTPDFSIKVDPETIL